MNQIKRVPKSSKREPADATVQSLRTAIRQVQRSARKSSITEEELTRELAARKAERLSSRR